MRKTKLALAISAAALASSQAYATNGMNMEGYGPVATAMGGAAQAYDNGLGGMMVNPATIQMDAKTGSIFQIAVGRLGPDVNASMSMMGIDQDSKGTAYYMPAIGYATKNDKFTWGIGVMGQGGMGTEYPTQASGGLFSGGLSMMGNMTALSGEKNRSELSVGRVIAPFNYEVNDKVTLGASVDFVWAGMDIMMDMSGSQFGALAQGGNVSGSMFTGLQQAMGAGLVTDVKWARFDFSDDSDYTGQAKGTGFGGKLGLTYKASDKLTIGASYHTKTNISDMTGDANISMNVNADTGYFTTGTPNGVYADMTVPLSGTISVKDFQWPSTIGLGMSYKANDKWTVNADFKRINWSETMGKFNMVFTADSSPTNGGFANTAIDVTLPQNWDDQNILQLGAEYQYSKALALRAGMNIANNPVPDDMVNPLFPATVERHYTLGFGYNINENSTFDFSLVHAPATDVTGSGALNQGLEISHAQTNWQAMYTYQW